MEITFVVNEGGCPFMKSLGSILKLDPVLKTTALAVSILMHNLQYASQMTSRMNALYCKFL
jgi:hypothetical protein